MSQWDIKALETNFEGFRKERYPSLTQSEAFERYVIRHVLRDEDLSDDEVEFGAVGGKDDGGIDGIYFFVNRSLIQDEADLPVEAVSARLVIVQAKLEAGFSETSITKLQAFAEDLLDHNRVIGEMTHLNPDVRDAITRFRDHYTRILASKHTMNVTFIYASKSAEEPHPKVLTRVQNLKNYVNSQLSSAVVEVDFWTCQRLIAVARSSPNIVEHLEFTKHLITDDKCVVCLVKLGSFAKLLRDNHGEIRRPLLEPNVRDYNGPNNPVNKAIKASLTGSNPAEFWWLNNGVTILAQNCSISGNKVIIQRPEVVNGLQTSHEIFQYFKPHPDMDDQRSILIRVIVPPDEQMRNSIIRATNSQTPIPPVNLHATDTIHFDIEEKLRLYQIYYDRRKGEHRELKKPSDQIVSIQTLARTVMAVLLQQPHNAYATPSRVLKDTGSYNRVFNDAYNRDMYVACALVQRQIDKYLLSRGPELKDIRSFLKYYVAMAIVCRLLWKTAAPSHGDLASLVPKALKPLDASLLSGSTDLVLSVYEQEGSTVTAAKGPDMPARILRSLAEDFIEEEEGKDG